MTEALEIWYCDSAGVKPADLAGYMPALSADECARRDRFVFERDRWDFAVAHAMLRHALSALAGTKPEDWRFEADGLGKPFLSTGHPAAHGLTFNLSHAPGLVACAVTRGTEVGIDVERIAEDRSNHAIPLTCFSPEELAGIHQCNADARRTRSVELWTLKEAYIKAVGCGLAVSLDSFGFEFGEGTRLRLIAPQDGFSWRFLLAVPSADSRMAIAVRAQSPTDRFSITMVNFPVGRTSLPVLRVTPAPAQNTVQGDDLLL